MVSDITGLEITLQAIASAYKRGATECYFWDVPGEDNFINEITDSPFVEKVFFDAHGLEPSKNGIAAKALHDVLEARYITPDHGYVAILKKNL